MTTDRVLLVDDEPNVIQAIRRGLHGRHKIFGAEGGAAALEMLQEKGPFAVIVCDMQMPDVDGLKVLGEAQKISPDTVRVMLTGNADQKTAIDAVNSGQIFRFVNKPCPAEKLGDTIDAAIRHYQVTTAEKTLLSRTLTGSIGLVSEVLAIANPQAYGRGSRLRRLAREIAKELELEDAWQYEIAAMLSYFGWIGVPSDVLERYANGELLSEADRQILEEQAATGARLIGKIPRLEAIAGMIELQHATNLDDELDSTTKVGAYMLQLLVRYDALSATNTASEAVSRLEEEGGFHPTMLKSLRRLVVGEMVRKQVCVRDLRIGMLLDDDVLTGHGEILIKRGHELTEALIHRLKAFEVSAAGVQEPFYVLCEGVAPIELEEAAA